MSLLHKGLILTAGLLLIFSLAGCLKIWRDLQAARRELMAVTTANEFLRKTLGDMTVAIATKDREIDRLEHSGCGRQENHGNARPGMPMGPDRNKFSKSDAVRHGSSHPWSLLNAHLSGDE